MIHRALVYVLAMRVKNGLLGLLRRPARLASWLLFIGVFAALAIWGRDVGGLDVVRRAAVLTSLLGLYLMLSLFAGLGESGPRFPPEDVDQIFPAPFRRRDVLVYHLTRQYIQVIFLALIYAVAFGGAQMPNPPLAYAGIVLCLLVCTHVQTAASLVTAAVSDHAYGRLRWTARAFLLVALGVAAVFAVLGVAGAGDVAGLLGRWMSTPQARVVLYPAVAAGELGRATTAAQVGPPLFGLLACVAATFGLVLLFPVNFMESAATRAARKRRVTQADDAPASGADGRARRVPLALFRGAGAVAWVNALTLRRQLRILVGALVMLVFILLFSSANSNTRPAGFPFVLVMLAFFPLLANMPLGFRGHREHLALLKTLPVAPTRLALAQTAVPVFVLYGLQMAIVGIFLAVGRILPIWVLAAAAAFPVLDLGIVGLTELFQMGRDRRTLGLLVATAQMMAVAASLMPALFVGLLVYEITGGPVQATAAAILAHLAVDAVILWALGRRFAAFEVTAGEG